MSPGLRSLLLTGALALVLAPLGALSIEGTQDSVARLRTLVRSAGEALRAMRAEVDYLDSRSAVGAGADPYGRGGIGGGLYADLERSARRLEDAAGDIRAQTAKCSKDVQRVGRDFASQARRVARSVNHLASASSSGPAGPMQLSVIRRDIERTAVLLQGVAGVDSCGSEEDTEEGAEDSPKEGTE